MHGLVKSAVKLAGLRAKLCIQPVINFSFRNVKSNDTTLKEFTLPETGFPPNPDYIHSASGGNYGAFIPELKDQQHFNQPLEITVTA